MNCGTSGGYAKHLRDKTPTCQPCKDANSIRRKDYYKRNPKKVYAINRTWASKNQEKIKEYSRRIASKRKALKLSNGHVKYTEQEVLNLYGNLCHICNIEIDLKAKRQSNGEGWQMGLHLDHLVSLSNGGSDSIENIRPSHAICNMKKGKS